MTEEPPHIISIYEKGTWKRLKIIATRRIVKTKHNERPQHVFDVKCEDGTIVPVWIQESQSTGSKYFSFLTAVTGDIFLLGAEKKADADTVDPTKLPGKEIMGFWGKERRSKGNPVDAFLRFLPCNDKKFKPAETKPEKPKEEEPPQEKPEKKQMPADYVPPAKPKKEPPKEEKHGPVEVEDVKLEKFM